MSQTVRFTRKGRRPKYDLAYLRRAAEAFLVEQLTYKQIHECYGIKRTTLQPWVCKFSEEILQTNAIGMSSTSPQSKPVLESGPPGDPQLRKALENANIKIAALEIMIQVAEEELGIRIRKKYGTKQ